MMTPRMSVRCRARRHVAQERANQDEASTPEDGTQRVKHQEFRIGVAGHARGDRNEGAYEGNEATDDERAPAVVCEVMLSLLQVLGLQDATRPV